MTVLYEDRQLIEMIEEDTYLIHVSLLLNVWLTVLISDYCTSKASTTPLPPPLVVVACNAYVHKGCDFESRPTLLYLLPKTFSCVGSRWEEKLARSEGKNIIKKEAGLSAAVKKWTIRKVTWEREWLE